ncbi:MAG: DUF2059 domain-containing protein [Pseudomonadota bacterium]
MKRTILTAASGIALAFSAAPIAAQTVDSEEPTAEEFAALGDLFGDMFGTADPLTEEQAARVPAAQAVVTKLFPVGTYAKMMDETMKPMFEGIMGEMGGGTPALALAKLTGLDPFALTDVDDANLEQALTLLDPQADARNAAMTDVTLNMLSGIFDKIEPAYRTGLARAYAVRFTQDELTELDAYFQTPVGAKYAAESFLIYADPQVMESMNEMMPLVMEAMPVMMAGMTEITEQYPEGRKFSALDDAEKEQLAALLGVSMDDLAVSEPQDYSGEEWEVEESYEASEAVEDAAEEAVDAAEAAADAAEDAVEGD